ncbi:hypothetical protein RB4172 [Rhodopirellula baltica SH 1]|uniref:Uncharacterized protein n=1 Tax=Rhodopirellula baltica (strain DSM 10527 / NCIMB 13988 / SH1) TaxID=243090 RepID=Q7UT18_RHOBA|nr:hypothetical protein RB4172 [Rhodopirellula baltica SH 1]
MGMERLRTGGAGCDVAAARQIVSQRDEIHHPGKSTEVMVCALHWLR